MKNLIERKAYLEQLAMWREEEMIKVVTGVRRCGKSTLFKLYINQLKSDGITDEQIIFVNLEDEDYSKLLDYKKLHEYVKVRMLKDKWTYVFIDEIQNCKDYERAISSLYLKKNLDIYITGSNAYMLSGELATKLTARYIEIDMLPLSFAEDEVASKITELTFTTLMNKNEQERQAKQVRYDEVQSIIDTEKEKHLSVSRWAEVVHKHIHLQEWCIFYSQP